MSEIISLVTIKGDANCKSRLNPVLTNAERQEVSLTMLQRVLVALASPSIQGRLLVGGNRISWKIAKEHSFGILPDDEPGLNHNLFRALQIASRLGYDKALILPADLPLINSLEVGRFIEMGKQHDAVIVPSKEGNGTNALLFSLNLNLTPVFGHNSFESHVSMLQRLGASIKIYRSPSLSMDLDGPEDWRNWGFSVLGKPDLVPMPGGCL